jgi:hypothetical protein
MEQVRRCAKALCALLICTDGLAAYRNSILKAFRYRVKDTTGPGAPKKVAWPRLYIGTVIKHRVKGCLTSVSRRMTSGQWRKGKRLLKSSNGGKKLNTAFIERLNGTFRERLASLARKCRHAVSKEATLHAGMYLVGCTYNLCFPHQELSKAKFHEGKRVPCTPAMASGITDHVWSIRELLTFKVAPPPLVISEEKKDKRSKKWVDPSIPRKPVLRLKRGALCATTR